MQSLSLNPRLDSQDNNPENNMESPPANQTEHLENQETEQALHPASQQLSTLRSTNIFTQRTNDPSTAALSSSALNHELIAEIMRGNQQESQNRLRHGQFVDQVNRALSGGRIPSASSGLAKSITAFAKSMLGMEQRQSTMIPVPPTEQEYELFANHRNEAQQAITQFVNNSIAAARQQHGIVDSTTENKIRCTAIREAKKLLPEVQYQRLPSNSRNSRYFATLWIAHGHRSLARSGIPRCTYDWSDNHDNPWNSTIIEVFLDAWGLSHQNTSTQMFRIESSQNTPQNQIAILQRWFDNTSLEWTRGQRLREANQDVPGYQPPARETSNAAKIRVCFLYLFFLIHSSYYCYYFEIT